MRPRKFKENYNFQNFPYYYYYYTHTHDNDTVWTSFNCELYKPSSLSLIFHPMRSRENEDSVNSSAMAQLEQKRWKFVQK